jgi:hypothetical protein
LKLAIFLRNLPRTKLGVLIGLLIEHVRLNIRLITGWARYQIQHVLLAASKRSRHFVLCVCPTRANLETQIFGRPILSVSEYEGTLAGSFVQFAEKSSRFETHVQGNVNYGVHIRPNK